MTPSLRQRIADDISDRLGGFLDRAAGRRVAFYWPMRGEPDLRPLVRTLLGRGVAAALPVVVEPERPLEFWAWHPAARMRRQEVWGIPVPAERNPVRPDVLLIPLIGFDRDCHRLGHGGGYYDRTLAILDPRPFAVGVGAAHGEIETIYPQPHDVAMDAIVTEREILEREPCP